MAVGLDILNSNEIIKTSIPLAESSLGQGFGFAKQKPVAETKEIEVTLSKSATAKNSQQNNILSESPLLQAVDVLSELNDKIKSLQQQYQRANLSSEKSKAVLEEFNSLSEEFKRIAESSVLDINKNITANLAFKDSAVAALYKTENYTKIESFNKSISDLKEINFEDGLKNLNFTDNIDALLGQIKQALRPQSQNMVEQKSQQEAAKTRLIDAPDLDLQSAGTKDGLNIALIGLDNKDLIKAAATHVNLEAVNVLLLTFNAPDPVEEEEREERDNKEKQQILVDNSL